MSEVFPLHLFVNKLFWPAARSAECDFARHYLRSQQSGNAVNLEALADFRKTPFYRLRTGAVNWSTPGIANLPVGVGKDQGLPPYWVMPWDNRLRNGSSESTGLKRLIQPLRTWNEKRARRRDFPQLAQEFFALVDSIREKGFDNSKAPIKCHLLKREDGTTRLIYLDGNRRLGVLAALVEAGLVAPERALVHADIRGRFERQWLWEQTEKVRAQSPYVFTREECQIWFDCAFYDYS